MKGLNSRTYFTVSLSSLIKYSGHAINNSAAAFSEDVFSFHLVATLSVYKV